jgi:hypothetical protein
MNVLCIQYQKLVLYSVFLKENNVWVLTKIYLTNPSLHKPFFSNNYSKALKNQQKSSKKEGPTGFPHNTYRK